MALIVEDGTQVVGAESYASVTFADIYHSARGNAKWSSLSVAQKEARLRKATQYLTAMYRPRWAGTRMSSTQALDWPRGYVYLRPFVRGALDPFALSPYLLASNTVPLEVQQATAEMALRADDDVELLADLSQQVLSEQVGSLQVTYSERSPQQKRYPLIDGLLSDYLGGGSSVNHELVRV